MYSVIIGCKYWQWIFTLVLNSPPDQRYNVNVVLLLRIEKDDEEKWKKEKDSAVTGSQNWSSCSPCLSFAFPIRCVMSAGQGKEGRVDVEWKCRRKSNRNSVCLPPMLLIGNISG